MEIPIDELNKLRLNCAFLECQSNSERIELLQLQLKEEKQKKPVLEAKLQGLINELHRDLGIEKAAPVIDLARGVIICQNDPEENSNS